MRRQSLMPLVGAVVLVGAGGCATKGYVKTAVAERTVPVEQRVTGVEAGLADTVAGTSQNAAHIREVDGTATSALDTATGAVGAASDAAGAADRAQTTASNARTRALDLEASGRRLLFEVVVREDHGQFAFGDATLPSAVSTQLDALVERVKALAAPTHLEIEGHTDATGPALYNTGLATRRAESVRRYLHQQHQLPLHKISVISYGEEQPIAPNDSIEGRAKNRRVVVRVLG